MALYLIGSGPMQTTAAFAQLATGTAIKTLMQLKASATASLKIVEWGCSFDGFTPAAPGKVELIETGTVAATVTAFATADITKLDAQALAGGDPVTNLIQVGTTSSGYNASAEGSIVAVRNLHGPQFISNTTQYNFQFPLGREPTLQINGVARIRVTFAATVNAYAYMIVDI